MMLLNKKDINFIKSKELEKRQITHGFFTKQGGVSEGIFDSLNCRSNSGDKSQNIQKNLAVVASCMGYKPSEIKLLKQVHSDKVILIDDKSSNDNLEGDGLITNKKEILLGVITADCVPILICDSENKIIAAVHAGWKGAFAGIIQNTIQKLQELGANLGATTAVIGPCIRQKNYLISNDFYDNFIKQRKHNSRYFKYNRSKAQYSFDLAKYCYEILQYKGVSIIEDTLHDTYEEKELFFSCRRNKHADEGDYGAQISVIGLKSY